MKIAVTGGTGFVGRHVVRLLADEGHTVVVIARGVDPNPAPSVRHVTWVHGSVTNRKLLESTLAGCDAVAHLAGINLERPGQKFEDVHVRGTQNVVDAARANQVSKVVLLSFLRARPGTSSPYHDTKWRAEEIVRSSGIAHTIFKSGVIYGSGDHMLDHLSKVLHTVPVFPLVGFTDRGVRPVAVADAAWAIAASLIGNRLDNQTVALLGPDEMPLGEAVRRVAAATGRRARTFRAPVSLHRLHAVVLERLMRIPPASRAQVQMLAEGIVEPWGDVSQLPPELAPVTPFSNASIAAGLPPQGGFGRSDLTICSMAS
ncbi:MAG: NAD(P)H-binding protein [Acidimicrobiia bacterium]|nr:NAD(P)H-binding protein [Acidimicrobiia bacterium]